MKRKYFFAAVSAYSLWGLFSLVLRPLSDFGPMDILYNRIVSCCVLLFAFHAIFRRKEWRETMGKFQANPVPERRRFLLWNVLMGLLLTGNWYLFIYVMNHISVRATSLAYLVCPILTALLAAFLLRERLSRLQWSGIFLGVTGCLVLSFGHFLDLALSVLVALSYALYLILQRRNAGYDSLVILSFHFLVALAVLTPFAFKTVLVAHPPYFYYLVLVIAVMLTIVPLWLNLYALKGMDSATVGMLINVNPIIAFLLALLYFREKASVLEIVGYSIVFLSVVVFNFRALPPRKA